MRCLLDGFQVFRLDLLKITYKFEVPGTLKIECTMILKVFKWSGDDRTKNKPLL